MSFFLQVIARGKLVVNAALDRALLTIFVAGLAGVASAQTVTLLQPKANTTVPSPVWIQATVQDTSPIRVTQIYVDGIKKYEIAASGVNTTLALATGQHRFTVQALDAAGRIFKTTAYATVGTSVAPAPSPSPSPSPSTSGSTVYTNVQQMTGWLTCGACGNSGGGGALANYLMTRGISTPSLSGSSAQFSIGGTTPYTNAYWYIRHTAPANPLLSLVYDFYIYVPSGFQNAPQAIEFECQQRNAGWVYNFAWQAEYTTNRWRVFNYVLKRWEDSGIPFTRFTPGSWHHIVAEYHTYNHTVVHDALTVDGVRHVVGLVHSALNTGNLTDEFTNAFQLDLNGTATPYHVFVDSMNVTLK